LEEGGGVDTDLKEEYFYKPHSTPIFILFQIKVYYNLQKKLEIVIILETYYKV